MDHGRRREQKVEEIRQKVGNSASFGAFGGVDSSVVAALVHRAIDVS